MKINPIFIALSTTIISSVAFANIAVVTTSDTVNPTAEEVGGKINFERSITNNNTSNANLKYYDYLVFPDKEIYIRSNAKNLTLAPGETYSQNSTRITVSPAFPSGNYQYVFAVYDKDEGKITASAFPFQKLRSGVAYASCNDIMQNGASVGNGIYTIDPDGTGEISEFSVYCDMTTQGGGWTLYANYKDGLTSMPVLNAMLGTEYGVLSDERWRAVRDNMTDGMLFIDEHNKVSRISALKLRSGNCSSINEITSLITKKVPEPSRNFSIWHQENSSCGLTGLDYSVISLYVGNTALYQYSSVKFDVWPYSGDVSYNDQVELKYFIK